MGNIAGIPVIAQVVNAANNNGLARKVLDKLLGVHPDATIPEFHSDTLRKREARRVAPPVNARPSAVATATTTGKVALFTTCYCNRNAPDIGDDLIAVLEHNGIPVKLVNQEVCCGMPKLELGDLGKVEQVMQYNIPQLVHMIDSGYDIIAPVPSCVLMFKQELPLLYPHSANVKKVARAFFDPFEYLMLRHKEKQLMTNFKKFTGQDCLSCSVPPACAEYRSEDERGIGTGAGHDV